MLPLWNFQVQDQQIAVRNVILNRLKCAVWRQEDLYNIGVALDQMQERMLWSVKFLTYSRHVGKLCPQ